MPMALAEARNSLRPLSAAQANGLRERMGPRLVFAEEVAAVDTS